MFAQYVLVNRVASLKWVYVKRMSASKQAIERERERERQGREREAERESEREREREKERERDRERRIKKYY